METNILVLSAGTRNKIIQYFKTELRGQGNVIAADMSEYAPALYEADRYYVVPNINDPGYIDIIIDICKNERVSGVLSLIDPELSLLALNRNRFCDIGVTVIGSSYELCELSLDKVKMYCWLNEHGYRCAKSYTSVQEFQSDIQKKAIDYPVFVKPVRGSASHSVCKIYDAETLDFLLKRDKNLIIQEYMSDSEIGADVYIDMISGEVVSVFTKRKLLMRAGETDKAISFKDETLFDLIIKFCSEAGYRGQVDIDLFEKNGNYYISEVNPRFGGGYPFAHECGINNIKLIMANLMNITNKRDIGNYPEGAVMMKYSEITVKNG